MKMRNKGKVYPSPSSSSTPMSSYSANTDSLSVLKLLPAAILALISVLSLEDREALAYMITRSIKSVNPSSIIVDKKKNNKKSIIHKPPIFDCECFDCYTSYWFRWDSSPNRELIHKAIEAFEEHLASEEQSKRNTRGKKREKTGRRGEKSADGSGTQAAEREADLPEMEGGFVVVVPENEAAPAEVATAVNVLPDEAALPAEALSSSVANNKGLAMKVFPDVVGLFNSRLWSLWGPNV